MQSKLRFTMRAQHIMFTTLLLFFSVSDNLFSLEYGIFSKAEGVLPPKNFALYAERCSGSNYAVRLILANTYLKRTPSCFKVPHQAPWHKHFIPWLDLPPTYDADPRNSNFKDFVETIFVVVVRNPYDWARSLSRGPHHAARSLYELPFTKFIRTPWVLNENDIFIKQEREYNPLLECDPKTGLPFRNIFKLRTAKMKNQLRLKDFVKNAYYIKYEDLRDHPEAVLAEFSKLFGIELKPIYQPVDEYKGLKQEGKFKPKKYEEISMQDLAYINSQLEEKIENRLGYKIAKTLSEINTEE